MSVKGKHVIVSLYPRSVQGFTQPQKHCHRLRLPRPLTLFVLAPPGLPPFLPCNRNFQNKSKHQIVDEMCDSGRTMACLKALMENREAASVKTCVMFDKKLRREVPASDLKLDYVGLECPDEFVVGYGMDWSERFRSLRHVCAVKESAYA